MELTRTTLPESAGPGLTFRFPPAAGEGKGEPRALLSLRSDGDMRYAGEARNANREAFFRRVGVAPERVLGIALAHSRAVLIGADEAEHRALLEEAQRQRGGADGLLSLDRRLVPTITAADCMPIWILDRASGAFGVLHSGWRGTGILQAAVEGLGRRFGSSPSDIAAILGPAVGSCCYDVPEERARLFLERYGPSAAFRREGTWRIDLREANIVIAERAGIGSLLSIDACTSCDERLGSYRRQGPSDFTCMAAACGRFDGQDA